MTVTREQLAAYADGQLAGEEKAAVAKAVAADPDLRRQLEAHRALKTQLGEHYAPIVEEPVPDRLTALLKRETPDEAEVVDFAAAREARTSRRTLPRWSYFAGPALAASLALVLFLPRGGDAPDGYAGEQLATVLDTQLVAEQGQSAEPRILLSFRNDADEYCRAYSGTEGGGIACRDETGWQLQALGSGSANRSGEYRQAGASDAELLAIAQDMADGPALDAEQESAARDSGWH